MSGYVNGHNILETSRYLTFIFIRYLNRRQWAEGLDTCALSPFCLQYMVTLSSHFTSPDVRLFICNVMKWK